MRALVVSIWVFINLVFFGMCGYMYLLWSQYWMFVERQTGATTSTYDQQIYYYNRGYLPNDTNKAHHNNNTTDKRVRVKHSIKDNVTITLIRNSKPRFPNVQGKDFELDTRKYACWQNDSVEECLRKATAFKQHILNELMRVLEDESNILKIGMENPYNVQYAGPKGNFADKSPEEIMCEWRKVVMKTLKRGDVKQETPSNLGVFLPKRQMFENRKFNSCVVVASAGALKGSKLGPFIDSHDLVLRFNNAPTAGFEEDVGRKTTVRILNSQVVTRTMFNFVRSPMYRNVTVAVWDPSNYKASLDEWLEKPEFNLFPNYVEYRKSVDKARVFLLNPHSLWELWDFLQANSPSRLRRNPVSSGFLGVSLLLPMCTHVDVVEFVPSTRATKRCHYYGAEENVACTFGVWHPLAAEKLLAYHVNTADDRTVFHTGYIRINPLKKTNQC